MMIMMIMMMMFIAIIINLLGQFVAQKAVSVWQMWVQATIPCLGW